MGVIKMQRIFGWVVALAGVAFFSAAQQTLPPVPPMPQPTPTASGGKPALPVSPLDLSQLTEEQRKRYEEFNRGNTSDVQTAQEWLARQMEPIRVPKNVAVLLGDGFANPHPAMPWKMRIVKEEGDDLWLQHLSPEDPESQLHGFWLRSQKAELLAGRQVERSRDDYYLDFDAAVVAPPSVESLTFQPVAGELPAKGRWQMGFAVADMNGDGVVDLVLPPERLGSGVPAVFLGAGEGRFTYWREARWTPRVPWDYGGLAVADLDGDGDQDVVIAIHFKGQYVVYNEGNGQFGRATLLPTPDPRLTSRAPTVADFDGDGRVDLAFLAELSYDQAQRSFMPAASTAWVVLNRGEDHWELVTNGLPSQVIGDSLGAADVDRDGRPDLLISAGTTNWRSLVWLNTAGGWKESYGAGVLSNAWHFQVVRDPLPPAGVTQLYAVAEEFKMVGGENMVRTAVMRYRWDHAGLSEPGQAVVVDDQANNQYSRLAAGDLNGDGRTDLVVGRKRGGLEVFVQTASGELVQERAPELEGHGRPFCVELLDLNGDGLDDIVASFVPREALPGGIYVWLTRAGA